MEFIPTGNPTSTESPTYEIRPITLGERTNLWGTSIRRTEAPSNISMTKKEEYTVESTSKRLSNNKTR